MQIVLKSYKKDFDYSYSFGAFPTYELLSARPSDAIAVIFGSQYHDDGGIERLCMENGIETQVNDKLLRRLSPKENCLVTGVFRKFSCDLSPDVPHIVLVNPSNMGNLGTIMRTMLGFSLHDLAIIGTGADILDPKSVRASMGAVFRIRHRHFGTIGEYVSRYGTHMLYPFMLDGAVPLDRADKAELFSLVFGNEAAGLPPEYAGIGQSVVIPNSTEVDSLNLSVAVGIAVYAFTKNRF